MFNDIPLKDDEELIYVVRKYGLVYFWWLLLVLILFAAPFFFMFWLFRQGLWGEILFAASLVLGLILLARVLFYWRNNKLMVTTHGIIDVHYENAFNKVVSRVSYDEMDDISGEICGIGGTIFRYGTVTINTGSGSVKIINEDIKDPVGLQAELKSFKRKYKRRSGKGPMKSIMDDLQHLEKEDLIKVIKACEELIEKRES